jgi:hypothetical protein
MRPDIKSQQLLFVDFGLQNIRCHDWTTLLIEWSNLAAARFVFFKKGQENT